MNILIVVNEFPPGPGGVGTHAYELARQLVRIGHTINVVCPQSYASNEKIQQFNHNLTFPIHTYSQSGSYMIRIFNRLVFVFRTINKVQPEIMIASGSNSIWIASLFRFWFRSTKLVVVAHGGELNFRSFVRRALTNWACTRANKIVCVSNYTKQFISPTLHSKVSVIHNGADHSVFLDRMEQEKLKQLKGWTGRNIILTVGSVSERKGQDIVIKALKYVQTRYPDILYIMAGRSNLMDYYERLIVSEGVEKNAILLGAVDTELLVQLYNLADLYVLVSRHSSDGDFEGFGISVIEAALCGVPAVVASNSGLTEAIENYVTGVAIEPENPTMLADEVMKLLRENARKTMGAAAKLRAQRYFTWERVALSYDALLASL